MKSFILRVVEIYKPFKVAMLVVFVFMLASQVLMLASPYIYGKIIDGIIAEKPMNEVLMLTVLVFAIFVVQSVVIAYYREKFEVSKLDFDISRHVSKKTMAKVLRFSVGQHNNQNSGVKQSIIDKGEHSLTTLAYTMLYDVFPIVLQVTLTIAALLYLSVPLGLIVLLGVVVFAGITVYLNLNFKDKLKEFEDMRHEHKKVHTEILRNVELVQLNAQEKRVVNEYDKSFAKINIFGKEMWTKFALFATLRNLTTGIARFVVMVVGVYYVYNGFYTPGDLVVFLTWSANAFGNLGIIGPIHRRCMEMYAAVKKYFVMLDIEPEVKMIKNPVRPERFGGRIEFKDVSFRYPVRTHLDDNDEVKTPSENNGKDTLSNISFVIEEGQRVAFVGHSGAGKSTIVHLLTRSYDPDHGQVIIDQNDLRIIDLGQYRETIGLVEQSVALFDNTLRYNITFGLNGRSVDITDDNLSEVAKLSCMDKFSNRLEKGFNTIIGEKGIRLSGGERQRVGIARALIKNPQFLVFDEATSNLDTENESMIRQSIEEASRGKTTIIIAHRLSTIKYADKIFVLDKGKIVGEGTHTNLLNSCDEYKRLVNHQVVTV